MLPYHLSFFVCFVFFSLGTRSDEIITSAFLFMKKHFRYFFLWKIYLFPYFEDVLYLPSPPSPPFWLSKRSSPIYREIGPDWVSLWQDKTFRNRARIVLNRVRLLCRAWFNNNSSPISLGSDPKYIGPDYKSDPIWCSIKRNRVGCLSFSGIPGPIFSTRTRIKTRTRLLYSDTNLNRIRMAAVRSDLSQVGSQRKRARFKVIGSELFWSGPIENWTQLVGANRIWARIVSHRARLPIGGRGRGRGGLIRMGGGK